MSTMRPAARPSLLSRPGQDPEYWSSPMLACPLCRIPGAAWWQLPSKLTSLSRQPRSLRRTDSARAVRTRHRSLYLRWIRAPQTVRPPRTARKTAASAVDDRPFESPHRIAATVAEFAAALGNHRRVAIARELTKKYEEILRGELGELAEVLAVRQRGTGIKGEIVLVVDKAAPGDGGEVDPLSVQEAASVVLQSAAAGSGSRWQRNGLPASTG